LLVPPPLHPVFAGVAGAIRLPFDPRVRSLPEVWSLARAVAADDEVAIVLPRSFSSALVPRLAGIPRRIGRVGDGRDSLLTDRLPAPPSPPRPLPPQGDDVNADGPDGRFHRWRDYAELAECLLEEPVPERYPLSVRPPAAEAAERLLSPARGCGPLVGLNPGSAASSRRWPGGRYAALGRELRARVDARVAVLGGPAEAALASGVAADIPGAVSLGGRTDLETLMGALARLDLLITNDSGPMHLAAALGTPLVELAGAGDERVTGPRAGTARVVRERLFCSPCVRNVCPFDLECMRGLTVARVTQASLELLTSARAA
jgi:heptosyltransferase-2